MFAPPPRVTAAKTVARATPTRHIEGAQRKSNTHHEQETQPAWVGGAVAVRRASFDFSKVSIFSPDQPSPFRLAQPNLAVGAANDPREIGVKSPVNSPGNEREAVDGAASRSKRTTGLPESLRAGVEQLSGLSMEDVRVYPNSSEPGRLHAHAFTWGTDIYLATGREQDLSHEVWHVVQQKQGRARPGNAQLKGASVVDDPGLEREADEMGERVAREEGLGQFRKDDEPVAFKPVERKVMQYKSKVPTNFGEFETTDFHEVTEKTGSGVAITLLFTPFEKQVDAKKIALSQSVRATTSKGVAYSINPDLDHMVKSGKAEGYAIDVPARSNNPIYAPETTSLSESQELKDTPASENTSADPTVLGKNSLYELGFCFKEKPSDPRKKIHPAGLVDEPLGPNLKGQGKTFETAAFAIDGTDKGKYYGSVKWGYKIEGTTAASKVHGMDITLASKGKPTANFMEAAKQWNVSRAQGMLRVAFDEVEVMKGNADGSNLKKATLPNGTKLRQILTLMVGDVPAIQAEILDNNGKGTGEFVFIENSKVEDVGGGAPTKKLPI
jgi:hypothetical protein